MDIEKEDGQNEFIICQLKSTDAESIRVQQKDLRVLEYNAEVSHKFPIFALQFLNTGEVWLMAKPEDFTFVSKYIKTGEINELKKQRFDYLFTDDFEETAKSKVKEIKSSESARNNYHEEQSKKYEKTRSAK